LILSVNARIDIGSRISFVLAAPKSRSQLALPGAF
jgi:hypothetical protein